MIADKFGQFIYNEDEVFDTVMESVSEQLGPFLINEARSDIKVVNELVGREVLVDYTVSDQTIEVFDKNNQTEWFMPNEYKELDIAEHVLKLCNGEAELQRCGEELLLYQDKDLFDLLRYLKYLVDVMTAHNIIWGVGRGSSVASFVLYKLKVHRVNSLYYNLSIGEFLR